MNKSSITEIQSVSFDINNIELRVPLLTSNDLAGHHHVNIFASGPSIEQQVFDDKLLSQASIFVNGSISLLDRHNFKNVVGYVISDARFIDHSLPVILQNYNGQPWYITLTVLQSLVKQAPKLVKQYHDKIRLIYAIDRPIIKQKPTLLNKLFAKSDRFKTTKIDHENLQNHNVIFNKTHEPTIGVSLDICQGFVEAGTVAFVASQLAFAMKAKEIHLFGIDLLNSNRPRFYENADNKAPIKLDKAIENRIVPSFDMLAEEYAKHGCLVYNHSVVSKTLFKTVTFIE